VTGVVGGCEAGKEKERGGGGGDEDVECRIMGIDSDTLATLGARKDCGEETEGGPATKK